MTEAAGTSPTPAASEPPATPNPADLLMSRSYLVLLLLGAAIGVPVAAVAYFFLKAVAETQSYVFSTLPVQVGFHGEPAWWPVLPLALSGLLAGLSIRYLPVTSGHKPAEGFKAAGGVA